MAEEAEDGEKKIEVKKEEKIQTKETFTKVENADEDDMSFLDNPWVWKLLILIVGIIIGYYVIPKIVELLRERQEQDMFIDYYPDIPPPEYYYPPPPLPERPVASPPIYRRKSAIDPLREMRTPESFKRHGIYLNEKGEAELEDMTIFETWTIQRDTDGKIKDAFRVRDDDDLEIV